MFYCRKSAAIYRFMDDTLDMVISERMTRKMLKREQGSRKPIVNQKRKNTYDVMKGKKIMT
jgi:hypothetical protein